MKLTEEMMDNIQYKDPDGNLHDLTGYAGDISESIVCNSKLEADEAIKWMKASLNYLKAGLIERLRVRLLGDDVVEMHGPWLFEGWEYKGKLYMKSQEDWSA